MEILRAFAHQRMQRIRYRFSKMAVVVFILLLANGLDGSGQTAPFPEYQVKAVFLFNFGQFVVWPTQVLPDVQTPLIIGVLGDDPFGAYLDEAVQGEALQNHPVVVQRYRRAVDIETCHILFISRTETDQLEQILTTLQDRHILTVSDITRFTRRGGMIRFLTQQNKIRLQINVEAAKTAGLTISSKLLKLAQIVGSGED